ncbi:MAG: ribonuclease H family protein [Ilumatobacteraceae bacterium]
MIVVYTDGACSGNPGPGGWAWAVAPAGEPRGTGGESHTTNQRMELSAVIEALRYFDGSNEPIEIRSDSTYVVNCFRDNWWVGWQKRGWKNSQRQPVANRDLWEPLIEKVTQRGDVTFTWVKAHNGELMNELVDSLAVAASLGFA